MKLKRSTSYALHAVMYMARHITQMPVSAGIIAKSEGISPAYMSKIFKQLVEADIIKLSSAGKGYEFVRPPHEISLLELFEAVEGAPLFDGCFMKHCDCGGRIDNCEIYACWHQSTRQMSKILSETSIDQAAWNHPVHRFNEV